MKCNVTVQAESIFLIIVAIRQEMGETKFNDEDDKKYFEENKNIQVKDDLIIHTCYICYKSYRSKKVLKLHIRSIHIGRNKIFL